VPILNSVFWSSGANRWTMQDLYARLVVVCIISTRMCVYVNL
jgi:hypothetical protein